MKRSMTAIFGVSLAGLTLASGGALAANPHLKDGHYKLDPGHTFANLKIGHMSLSTIHGRMNIKSGTVVIDQKGGDSKVNVTFDPSSVDTGNKARDEHLRDMKGFFDVKKYPVIKFVSSGVTFDNKNDTKATVHGKLTLHGVTKPVTLAVHDIACRMNPIEKTKYTCGFAADTKLKRSDYGMDAFSSVVGDRVELSIDAEASMPMGKSS